jgi:FMN phosphatase YigB (HAD superfamily)
MNRLKLVIFDLDDTLFDSTGQLGSPGNNIENIRLFPGVTGLLEGIRARGIRAVVVSTGDPAIQELKVQVLGLRNLLDAVYICASPEDKQTLFERCFREFGVQPQETLVVGDRIDREIQWGKSAGCVTVRVLHGRHSAMISTGENQVGDFTIQNIAVLGLWFGPWLSPGRPETES